LILSLELQAEHAVVVRKKIYGILFVGLVLITGCGTQLSNDQGAARL
jgi:hypothetical protein